MDAHGGTFLDSTADPNWRDLVITQGSCRGRKLLDLSREEFAEINPEVWLAKVEQNWYHPQVTDELRRLAKAVRGRLEQERAEGMSGDSGKPTSSMSLQPATPMERAPLPANEAQIPAAPIRKRETVATTNESAPLPAAEQPTTTQEPLLIVPTPQQEDEILVKLETANAALDRANSLEEVKQIADMAAAVQTYAKRAKLGEVAENKAAAYVCRALAKLGRMMPVCREAKKLQKRGRPQKRDKNGPFSDSTTPKPKTLAELGIDKHQATQARKLAKFPEPEFESRLKAKLDKLELSKTSTLEDRKPKKESEPSRYFVAFLRDMETNPASYDGGAFADDRAIVALYRRVHAKLFDFFKTFSAKINEHTTDRSD